jgi:hypothetical protein
MVILKPSLVVIRTLCFLILDVLRVQFPLLRRSDKLCPPHHSEVPS